MIDRRFPVIITVWLTVIGVNLNYPNKSALSQIQPDSDLTLIAQASKNIKTTPLKLGDKGERVKLLQNTLKSLGYFKGKSNGVFDKETKRAVSEFQRKQGLPVNGIASLNLQEVLQRTLFDQYMNLAYTATANKDYQLAKKQFEQALKIQPENTYTKKAIENINQYITRFEEQQKRQEKEQKIQENLWLIGLISGALLILIVLLILLIKKSKNHQTEEEIPLKTSENIETEITDTDMVKPSDLVPTNIKVVTKKKSSSNHNSLLVQEDNARLNKVDGIEELIKDLSLTNGTNRRKAIWELAQRSDSRAMQPLVQLMIEADSQERGLILEAISQISTRTLKPLNRALAVSLQDENAQVRLNAIRDLSRIYELIGEVNQRLYHATDDEDPEVRETAQWAINNLNKMQLSHNQKKLPSEDN